MKTEIIVLNTERNVTLTAYIQNTGGEFGNIVKRPVMLVLPGGGYSICSDREADPVALPYLKAGYQVFILRYSLKKDAAWPQPLNDYEQAVELIRSKTDEWHLYADRVAVVGFSAGGHLAGAAATMARNKPDAAILGYAVLSDDVKGCNRSAPDTISAVSEETCPCFIFATRNDSAVPVRNSIRFMDALAAKGIAFESHIYAYGPHGFSTADSSVQSAEGLCDRVQSWVSDSIGWLKDMFGDFGNGCMTKPRCPKP
jgi:acetyl esterase/lipase